MPSVFDSLPDEVIEFILSVKSLGCKDVCCFGQCCKRFHGLVKGENLWKRKANERLGTINNFNNNNFINFYSARYTRKNACSVTEFNSTDIRSVQDNVATSLIPVTAMMVTVCISTDALVHRPFYISICISTLPMQHTTFNNNIVMAGIMIK